MTLNDLSRERVVTKRQLKNHVVLSLGAGVQSSAMLIMSDRGEIERADYAVFADTQAEPKSVYEWLNFLKASVTIPVYTVTKVKLGEDMFGAGHFASVPFYSKMPDGSIGMLRRQCTKEYKLAPIYSFIRKKLGCPFGGRIKNHGTAKMLIGISRDEVVRMKPSREPWVENSWPLVERSMRREDCFEYVKSKLGKAPPRSACVFCPYHNNKEWIRLRDQEADEFKRAVEYETRLRALPRWKGEAYLHRSCVPLAEVDFENKDQLDFFGNECEGMCGV